MLDIDDFIFIALVVSVAANVALLFMNPISNKALEHAVKQEQFIGFLLDKMFAIYKGEVTVDQKAFINTTLPTAEELGLCKLEKVVRNEKRESV